MIRMPYKKESKISGDITIEGWCMATIQGPPTWIFKLNIKLSKISGDYSPSSRTALDYLWNLPSLHSGYAESAVPTPIEPAGTLYPNPDARTSAISVHSCFSPKFKAQ
ncbi:hypothetical protein TWF694_006660 [Orbilia ellipsospora]|uniref:Uncharacterized protein n=1 Tax=Orbilia ellipsospora TaxID=2528407 RepID=A0AAV9XKS6_9PEZI